MMTIEIVNLDEENEKNWEEYIFNHPHSTFFHQMGWKRAVERTYGHEPLYIIAIEDGVLKGVLPLFLIKSRLFGKKIVSMPFGPYGGICADNEEIEAKLINTAIALTNETKSKYVELRNLHKLNLPDLSTFYATLVLKLDDDLDVVWKNFSNKVRNSIRKSLKSGLKVELHGDIGEFYSLYCKNMKRLGSPQHSYGFFNNLSHEFHENINVAQVTYNDKVIAAMVLLSYKDTVISGWAASDIQYLKLNPNNILYWEVIKKTCEKHYSYFDFGRSLKNSGTFKFKKPWGADVKQLYYQYYLNNNTVIPNITTENPKRKMFSKFWSSLPLKLTEVVGPHIRANFP